MNKNTYKLLISSIALLIGALFVLATPVQAQNTAAISQGFQTNEASLNTGTIVSLERGNNGRVQLANTDRVQDLAGVVNDHPLISLSSGSSQVQVVIGGIAPVLVSDINGDIKTGDKITASPINGIGMKATKTTQVVGTAQQDMTDIKTQEVTIADINKKPQVIHVGTLLAQVNVTYYAVENDVSSFIPPFLQQLANGIAGREVPVLRVVISLVLMLAGFLGAGILLYSAVRSSIISIGRNPLSESAVRKSLIQVALTSLAILVAAAGAIYIVLTV